MTTQRSVPDLAAPAGSVDDPLLLLARIGYRAYLTFRGDDTQTTGVASPGMTDDLDRVAELLGESVAVDSPATARLS